MEMSAFTAWQMGAGNKKSYKDYLKKLGLLKCESKKNPSDLRPNRKPVKQMMEELQAFRGKHYA